jgi:hypothetical protein
MAHLVRAQYGVSLSSKDLKALLDGRVRIYRYAQLRHFSHINQVLSPYGCAIVLYQSKPNYGHWVALSCVACPNGKRVLEHFDPLGFEIDGELKNLPPEAVPVHLDRDGVPLLTALVLRSGYDAVVFNKTALQSPDEGINTCGRHCAVRLMYKDLSLPDYIAMFRRMRINPDFFVTALTMSLFEHPS